MIGHIGRPFDARILAVPRKPNWHAFMCTEDLVLLGLRVGHEVLNGQANLPCPHDGHGVPRQSFFVSSQILGIM